MRSARLLAVTVLAVVLALSSAQNAFAKIELAYDDGVMVGGAEEVFVGVLFSLPSGVSSARLLYIRWAWSAIAVHAVDIYITGPDHQTTLTAPLAGNSDGLGTGCPAGWGAPTPGGCNGVDVSGLGIVVSGDFYVILNDLELGAAGNFAFDMAASVPQRSFFGATLAAMTAPVTRDVGIRVDIDPIAPAVGGIVTPVNTMAVLAPWLAVIGLVGCVTAVAVVAKKRQ